MKTVLDIQRNLFNVIKCKTDKFYFLSFFSIFFHYFQNQAKLKPKLKLKLKLKPYLNNMEQLTTNMAESIGDNLNTFVEMLESTTNLGDGLRTEASYLFVLDDAMKEKYNLNHPDWQSFQANCKSAGIIII